MCKHRVLFVLRAEGSALTNKQPLWSSYMCERDGKKHQIIFNRIKIKLCPAVNSEKIDLVLCKQQHILFQFLHQPVKNWRFGQGSDRPPRQKKAYGSFGSILKSQLLTTKIWQWSICQFQQNWQKIKITYLHNLNNTCFFLLLHRTIISQEKNFNDTHFNPVKFNLQKGK